MRNRCQHALRSLTLLLGALVPCTVFGQTTVTVLHVGDSHSHLDAFGPKDAELNGTIGGIARVATVVGAVRASTANTLLLHAGDVSQGDLFFNAFFGVPEYELLGELGLDAMTVGNHEFDLGPGVLDMALSRAGDLPLVSSNLSFDACSPETCGALSTRIRPRLIKDVGGVKIGIFGLTVPGDPLARPSPVVIRDDVVAISYQMVGELRASGAQVVIALSHLGIAYDQAVAANVPGIDFVISGHDHALTTQPIPVVNPEGKTTLIVAAGEFYQHVGQLRFSVDGGQVSVVDYSLIALDETVPAAPAVQQLVEGLKARIVESYGDVYHTALGVARRDVSNEYDAGRASRDTGMGNLVADALRLRTGTQIALTTSGLISEGLYAGPIVGADVFRGVSYGYDTETGLGLKLATLRITGGELLRSIELCLAALGLTNAYDLQVSGLSYSYDSRQPVGQRLIADSVRVHGWPIHPRRLYTVTVNEAIAALLPSLGVTVQDLRLLPVLEYVALRDHIACVRSLRYGSFGRIRDVALAARRNAPCAPDAVALSR